MDKRSEDLNQEWSGATKKNRPYESAEGNSSTRAVRGKKAMDKHKKKIASLQKTVFNE